TDATCPGRKWNAEVALARDAPIPLEMFNPMLITYAHIFRVPLYLASRLQQSLFLVENAQKPLPRLQVFDWRIAAFVNTNVMLYRLLPQNKPSFRKIVQDAFANLCNEQTG